MYHIPGRVSREEFVHLLKQGSLCDILIKRQVIYMSDTEKKRVRRTTEERIAEVNAKIEELNGQIQSLEEKKQEAVTAYNDRIAKVMDRIKGLEKQKAAILAPKPPRKPRKTKKEKIQDLMKQAQRAGLKPEEIAERLGLTIQE
jgi:hypothetical protein